MKEALKKKEPEIKNLQKIINQDLEIYKKAQFELSKLQKANQLKDVQITRLKKSNDELTNTANVISGNITKSDNRRWKRLFQVAKELDVGTSAIVEHLLNSGFEIENRPTVKITEEMEAELLKEFSKLIAIKEQAGLPIMGDLQRIKVRDLNFDIVFVKGGTFQMGSEENDAYDSEKPVHEVTLSDYYIGKYPVTQELFSSVMDKNPSYFKGDKLPVERVSWNVANEFINKLNKETGKNYRLPTEAEWEFAARGGNKSGNFKYAGTDNLEEVGWYSQNSKDKTHPVGEKSPNELGICDMSGNVWEWCNDRFGGYDGRPQTNPQCPETGSYRVTRGGS